MFAAGIRSPAAQRIPIPHVIAAEAEDEEDEGDAVEEAARPHPRRDRDGERGEEDEPGEPRRVDPVVEDLPVDLLRRTASPAGAARSRGRGAPRRETSSGRFQRAFGVARRGDRPDDVALEDAVESVQAVLELLGVLEDTAARLVLLRRPGPPPG